MHYSNRKASWGTLLLIMLGRTAAFPTAHELLRGAVQSGDYPQAVLMVARSNGPVTTHVVGENVGLESLFLLASVTKAVWATGLMRLVERGCVVLTDPVRHYLPEFTGHGKEHVAVWHLLTHTSGLIEAPERVQALITERAPATAWVDLACATELAFQPGTRAQYGSLGFIVVAELISRLGGAPYQAYFQQQVFMPLGMHDTGFSPLEPQRVAPMKGVPDADDLAYLTSIGASVWSTPHDLLQLGRALLAGGTWDGYRLLSPAAFATMTRLHTGGLFSHADGSVRPASSGLGWGKRSEAGGIIGSASAFGHTGADGCLLWVDPEYDFVCVLLSGCWQARRNILIPTLNAVYGELP